MKTILKKCTAYLLTLAMLIALVPLSAFAEGEQTADLTIYSLADLEAFRDRVNGGETYEGKYILLAADIDMSGKYGKGKESWTPIGGVKDAQYNPSIFEGSFDGGGRTISGLYIESNAEYQGLFGYVEKNGTVKNLNVSGEVIVINDDVGLVVGYNLGTISNVRASGNADGTNKVGLIAGKNGADAYYLGVKKAKIENSYADGTVNGYGQVGLIAGLNKSLISKCSSSGTFSLDNSMSICSAGGICGENSDNNAMVEYSYNAAKYADKTNNNKQVRVGGISGWNNGGKISYCYNTVTIEAYNAGGIACYNDTGTITQCYQYGRTMGTVGTIFTGFEGNVNPITRKSDYGKVESSYYYNVHNNGEYPNNAGNPIGGLQYQDELVGWDFDTVWKMDAILGRPFLRNNLERGTADKPHEITTTDALQSFSYDVNGGNTYEGEYIKLKTDIRYEYKRRRAWTPIGTYDAADESNSKPFKGNFDGEGHLIIDWGIDASESDYQGLFGYTDGATVENIRLNGEVNCRNYVGMIVGYGKNSTIENVTVQGSVSGKQYVGGIAGKIDSGTIRNNQNRAAISGDEYVGGIAGFTGGDMYTSFNAAEVNGTNYVGGIAGMSDDPTISNCYNVGGITATETGSVSGGICGEINNTSVSKVYNIGTVSSSDGEKTHGAISGKSERSYVSCAYCLADVASTGGGIKLEAEKFKVQDSFGNFDFADIWVMNPYLGRPVLRSCTEYVGGTEQGTENNPYTINNIDDLEAFRDSVNGGETYEGKFVKLTTDIDLSEKYGEDKINWTAIGDYNSGKQFNGSFDGDNHKITGMYIKGGSGNAALFSRIGSGGTVKNLAVSGEVTQSSVSGIVAAMNYGTIINVNAAGSISGNQSVGGISGENYGTIENCSNEATVNAVVENAGGICADNNGSVKNCYNTGSVTGKARVGGICGSNNNYRATTIQNCYNAAPVTASNELAGGICGANDASVNNCYNVGPVTATTSYAGGISGGNNREISNCYNYASITSNGRKAAICASIYPPLPPKNCYYNGDAFDGTAYIDDDSGDPIYDGKLSESEFADKTKFSGFDFESTWVMYEKAGRPMLKGMEEPDGSEYNPLKIRTLTDLEEFGTSVNGGNNYLGKKVFLMADIDMSEKYGEGKESWTPIGHWFSNYDLSTWFNGTFEGNGHKITGLYIEGNADNQGLFGTVYTSGTIRNLTVSGNVSGGNWTGMLAGKNFGLTENVTVYGSVNGSYATGGIVGYCNTSNSYIKQCTNFAAVSGEKNVGGIVGEAPNTTVQECRNMGTIYASKYYAGGISGGYGTIQNCYNTAPVSADNYGAGGIAGFGKKIQNCYNTAPVSAGNDGVGGIIGLDGSAENCYNIGSVSAAKDVGGIIGNYGTAKNCYHTTGADNDIGTIVTDAQLADKNTFADWDFAEIWEINPMLGRPVLRSVIEGESGTESDPYIINNLEIFEKFRSNVNNGLSFEGKFVKLTSDIDLSAAKDKQWIPIGTKENPFSGTFDGNRHKITGLYINDINKSSQGLFGTISGGTVKMLGVANAQVSAGSNFGGIAANLTGNGKIENCYFIGVLGILDDNNFNGEYSGGIVSDISSGTVKNCYANVDYNLYSLKDYRSGVIAGAASNARIISCYFNLADDARKAVGNGYSGCNDEYTGGKTLAELADQSTYFGWDFENVWSMHPFLKLPVLSGSSSGTGTEENPYIISTLDDLELLASAVNNGNTFEGMHFALDADIDMSQKYNSETANSWTPIGSYSSSTDNNAFSGTFDGRNHKISGLFIKDRAQENTGLFSYIGNGACIKNLSVQGSIENSEKYNSIGGIAGITGQNALIENCISAVDITCPESYNVGGIVGYSYGTIKNSYASGNISGKGTVGGIVGDSNSSSIIQNCYSLGSISGENNVGGLAGSILGTAVNCYSCTDVNGGKPLFGYGWGTVKNCYYTGDTEDTISASINKTQAQFASGEVAYLLSQGCTVDGTFYDGLCWKQTIGTDNYPGFTGSVVSCTTGCPSYNNDGDTSEKPHTFSDDGTCSICGQYKGAELVNGVYQIKNENDLVWFAELVNGGETAANAALVQNIALNGEVLNIDGDLDSSKAETFESFTPIGNKNNPYSGTFNGNGHTISGLYINNSESEYVGLFGVTSENAILENINITDSYVAANKYVGILAGQNNGSVESCTVEGKSEKINYSNYGDFTGGICGENNGSIIGSADSQIIFRGKVAAYSGSYYIGGITGRNTGTVTYASNYGEINVTAQGLYGLSGSYVGGIAGANGQESNNNSDNSLIGSCTNFGTVHGGQNVGGICGINFAKIEDCTAEESTEDTIIASGDCAGGIAGVNNGDIIRCANNIYICVNSQNYGFGAGIAGKNSDTGSITECINNADIAVISSSQTGYAGGISAVNDGKISDCINSGSGIAAPTSAGGIAGGTSQKIQYCINTASAGGIAGICIPEEITLENCYFLTSETAYNYGTSATAEEFKNGYVLEKLQSGRTENIWGQDSGDLFPKLLSFGKLSCRIEISGNDITFHAPKGTYTAIIASYKTGVLIKAVTENLTIDDSGKTNLPLSNYRNSAGTTAKIMLWNSLDSMKPVCRAATVNN